jgi:hypothetical protein
MSNRDLCITLINGIEEEKLANVAVMLQSIKNMIDESIDDVYCARLYEDYLNDPDPQKHKSISLEDYAKELGVAL